MIVELGPIAMSTTGHVGYPIGVYSRADREVADRPEVAERGPDIRSRRPARLAPTVGACGESVGAVPCAIAAGAEETQST